MKTLNSSRKIFCIAAIAAICCACSLIPAAGDNQQTLPADTPVHTIESGQPDAQVIVTSECTATGQTPAPLSTPDVKTSFEARVYVDSLVLRSGPGSLFEAIESYPMDSTLSVVGRAAGDEWVKVDTDDHRTGWMLALFLEMDGDLSSLQLEEVKDCLTIFGNIRDEEGQPVDRMNLAVYQYNVSQPERTDAYSTTEGTFYAYIPVSYQGTWAVEIVGYGCDSRIMDDDCKLPGHFEPDRAITFDLPYPGPFNFTYVAN